MQPHRPAFLEWISPNVSGRCGKSGPVPRLSLFSKVGWISALQANPSNTDDGSEPFYVDSDTLETLEGR
jgi:hypothetical protein